MNEILKEELENNIGKDISLFLKNGFRYRGIVLAVDEDSIKINDVIAGVTIIALDVIAQILGGVKDGRKK